MLDYKYDKSSDNYHFGEYSYLKVFFLICFKYNLKNKNKIK